MQHPPSTRPCHTSTLPAANRPSTPKKKRPQGPFPPEERVGESAVHKQTPLTSESAKTKTIHKREKKKKNSTRSTANRGETLDKASLAQHTNQRHRPLAEPRRIARLSVRPSQHKTLNAPSGRSSAYPMVQWFPDASINSSIFFSYFSSIVYPVSSPALPSAVSAFIWQGWVGAGGGRTERWGVREASLGG